MYTEGAMLNFSWSAMAAGFVFGVFGFSFIKHGKKEGNMGRLIMGVILCVYPYFITSPVWTWINGAVLMFIAFKWT
jgi:Na+/proline symporter